MKRFHGDARGLPAVVSLAPCAIDAHQVLWPRNSPRGSATTQAAHCTSRLSRGTALSDALQLRVQGRDLAMAHDHIRREYGSVAQYLRRCGVGDALQRRVRENLVVE